MKVMAKRSVNKSALVREYLAKYPEKGPSAIANQITEEHGVKLSGKFVATVKTKLKQAAASPPAPANKKPGPVSMKSTPAQTAPAPISVAGLSLHIANLKAAAQRLGKDEAKRIIDL